MSTYDDDEKSVEAAIAADLYTITTPVTTYRLTGPTPITFGGNTYAATTISRSSIMINSIDGQNSAIRQVTVEVSLNHALAQDLMGIGANGLPWAQDVTVQIGTYMGRSAALRQWFIGTVASVASKGKTCQILVSGKLDQKLSVQLPIAVSQRLCQHGLYDSGCTIAASGFQVVTTVASISADGKTIGLNAATPGPTNGVPWALYGLITRTADNEPRGIAAQGSTTSIVLELPFRSLIVGDAIVVNAGCDHAAKTCRDKYSNIINYGGHPLLPVYNVQSPLGVGTLIQVTS